jgi:Bacterial Ig-like domain (group 3)/Galactose oxidase, central domain/Kelch motif
MPFSRLLVRTCAPEGQKQPAMRSFIGHALRHTVWRYRSYILLALAWLFLASATKATPLICPTTIENEPPSTPAACSVLLTVGSDLKIDASATRTLTYNGSDSTFGIINDSNSVITSVFLKGGDITDFTLDGIAIYVPANSVPIPPVPDTVFGYETYYGPSTAFTQVDYAAESLVVNFTAGLLPGTSTYFSLAGDPYVDVSGLTGPDGAVTATAAASTPEPTTWGLIAAGLLLIAFRQRGRLLASRNGARLSALAMALAAVFLAAPIRAANIVTLPSSPKTTDVDSALAALKSGSVVAMATADPAQFSGYFSVQVPISKKNPEIPLRYCVIAAKQLPTGKIRTYVGPRVMPGVSNLASCMADMQTWTAQFDQLQDNDPVPQSWIELSLTTVSNSDSHGDQFQEIIGIYRVSSSSTQSDFYMVTKQMSTTPNVSCDALTSCGYVNYKRTTNISTDIPASTPGYGIYDHGPLSQNSSTTNSFSIGASISGLNPGLSATFGKSWTTEDVTTSDKTNLTTQVAAWEDDFKSVLGYQWYGTTYLPAALKNLWTSYEAVIYQVPASTTSFSVVYDDTATFQIAYQPISITKESSAGLDGWFLVSPPSLSIAPTSLKMYAGSTASFDISAIIPNTTNGDTLTWAITNIPNGPDTVSVNTTTGAGSQTIQVTAPATAPKGLIGTLNINTVPGYASPEVRTGPLQLPITIVNSSDVAPGILITGGSGWTGVATATAELWSPTTGKSTPVGPMTGARVFHTATTMQDGRVFITGGLDDSAILIGTTEYYTPALQTFTAGPPLYTPRAYHTASLLPDGTILITGGVDSNGNALNTAELYNPADNTHAYVGTMTAARMQHTATVLPNGTVLITGGIAKQTDTNGIFSAEIFDPNTKKFTALAYVSNFTSTGFAMNNAALLDNGRVMFSIGQYPTALAGPTEYGAYIPQVSELAAFSLARPVNTPTPEVVQIPNGKAIMLGETEYQSASAKGFGQVSTNFTFQGDYQMQENRNAPRGLLVRNTNTALDGKVVVAGGVMANTGSTNGTAVEAFDPNSNTWSTVGSMLTARSGHRLTLLGAAPSGSTIMLTSSLNPATAGQNVTFTATVTTGEAYPTGTVNFLDGTTQLASFTLSGAPVQFTTDKLSVGTHSITAVYSGNSFWAGATSSIVSETIKPVQVTPVYSALSPSQSIPYSQAGVNLAGTLSAPNGTYPPAGELVSIVIGGNGLNAILGASGTFTYNNFPTGNLSAGSYTIYYTYAGDSTFQEAKDSSTTLTVNPPKTTFSNLTASQTIGYYTASVTLTGTVGAGGMYPASGEHVTITIGNTPKIATIGSNGAFTFSYPTQTLPAGNYPITYSYAGDASLSQGSDTSTTLTIGKITPVFSSLTASQTINAGTASIKLSGKLTQSAAIPTGSVSAAIGTASGSGSIDSNGNFSITVPTNALAASTTPYTINYKYNGDTNFNSQGDASTTLTVSAAKSSFSNLTASQTIGYYTASVTLAGTVSASGVYPASGEQVTITIANTPKIATIGSNGAFTFSYPTRTLAAGNYPITYTYGGNASLSSATDTSTTLTIGKITPVFSNLTASQTISAGTASIKLSGKLTQSAAIPTGSVSATIGTASGSGSIDTNGNFSITVQTGALTALTTPYTIDYKYNGDTNFNGQGDISTTLTVNPATVTPAFSGLTSAPKISVGTATVALSGALSAPGPVYPTVGEPVTVKINGQIANGMFTAMGMFSVSFPTASLAAGSYPITYSYGGDANLSAATDGTTNLTVGSSGPVSTTVMLVALPNPSTVGQTVTFTATVATGSSGIVPTGNVTISEPLGANNVLIYGNADLVQGVAKIVVTSTSPQQFTSGTHTLYATYGGDSNYNGATSPAYGMVVNPQQ